MGGACLSDRPADFYCDRWGTAGERVEETSLNVTKAATDSLAGSDDCVASSDLEDFQIEGKKSSMEKPDGKTRCLQLR